MSVYSQNGEMLASAYNYQGELLGSAYTSTGELIPISNDFVVMTWNVQEFNGINSGTMGSTIFSKYNPTIVGAQECTYASALTNKLNSNYSGAEISGRYGLAFAGLPRFYDITSVFYTSQLSGGHRGYQKAYFDYNGKKVCFANTHLDYSDFSVQVGQMTELFNAIKNEPYFIVTGDFNTPKETTSTSSAGYQQLFKQWIDAGCHSANCSNEFGFFSTWFGTAEATNGDPCDSIITSSSIPIKSIHLDTTKIEAQTGQVLDHLPLIAYLDL